MVEAPDPHGMVPISSPNIWNVLDIIHMLWMFRWILHLAVTTAAFGSDMRNRLLKPSVSSIKRQMLWKWSDWGSRPTWNGSNILSKHKKCDWHYSYAVRPHRSSIIMLLPLQWLGRIWEIGRTTSVSVVRQNYGNGVIEAPNPHGMVPTSSPNI